MFEKEVKFIVDFSLNKVKNLGSFLSFEKLLSTEIHPAILHYISAEIDFLIFEDRKKLIQNSVFDYSGPEIAKYFNLIGQEVKKTRKISFEDIKKLITQAVSFNVNYVSRPRWSLSKLIFNEADSKPIDEIRLSLNYVYYYDYLKNILLSYINKKKAISLSLIEFEVLLNKIDKELFADQSIKLVDNTLYSIADFMNTGSSSNKIPVQPVEEFLKERNLIEYLFKLRRVLPVDAKQKYSVEELRSIIYSTAPEQPVKDAGEPGELIKKDDNIPDILYGNDLRDTGINSSEAAEVQHEISAEELFKEFNEPFDFVSDKNDLSADNNDEEIILSSSEDENFLKELDEDLKSLEDLEEMVYTPDNNIDIVNLQDNSESERTDDMNIKENKFPNDLVTYLKDKEIDRIVNSVFDEDREDFAITMDRISECPSYDKATEILKSVFLTYRVNPYSRDAVTFTNAVANYFNQA
jgi:hypothetical protein